MFHLTHVDDALYVIGGCKMSDSYVFFLCSCKSPVYEVPQGSYTGVRILEILLDPDIDQSNVCHNRPLGIIRSSTFVVDLESLPEDIKKRIWKVEV